jgi:hypothetical protein
MRFLLATTLVFTTSLVVAGQEKPVPKDSTRVTLPGCVSGRMFTVMRRETPEPVNSEVALGRHFRLNGKREMLKEIGQPRAPMGGGSGVGSDPMYNTPGFDVESWTPLPDRCPAK